MAAVLVSGCGKKAADRIVEESIEASVGGKAKVDIKDNSMTIQTDEGTLKFASGGDAKIPASFPQDILVYKDASIQTVMEVPQGFNIILQTHDAAAKVQEAYQTSMTSQGWTQEMAMDMGEQKMLTFKKEQRTVSIVMTPEDGATQIAMTVAKQE
jgi:hypothetical protein